MQRNHEPTLPSIAPRNDQAGEETAGDTQPRATDIEHRIPWSTVATVESGKAGHVSRDLINITYEDPLDPEDQVATS